MWGRQEMTSQAIPRIGLFLCNAPRQLPHHAPHISDQQLFRKKDVGTSMAWIVTPSEDQCRRAHHPKHPTLQSRSNQIFLAGFRALVSAIPSQICIIRRSVHGIIVYGSQHLNSGSDNLRVDEIQTSSLITLDCPDASGDVASHLAAVSKSADGIRGCAGQSIVSPGSRHVP